MRRLGESIAERRRATRPGEVWSWDFVTDMTRSGYRFGMLTLIDEYTRQCLAIYPAWSIRANHVIEVVTDAIKNYGQPEHLRSDNGPEFIAYAIKDWLADLNVKTIYISPGSPWEQAHIESFHDKFVDECLNRELFESLAVAKVIVDQWRKEYNQQRPHSSLGYQTPDEFAAICNRRFQSGYNLLPSPIAEKERIIHTTNNPAELDFQSVHSVESAHDTYKQCRRSIHNPCAIKNSNTTAQHKRPLECPDLSGLWISPTNITF